MVLEAFNPLETRQMLLFPVWQINSPQGPFFYKEAHEGFPSTGKPMPLGTKKMLLKDGNGRPFAQLIIPNGCSVTKMTTEWKSTERFLFPAWYIHASQGPFFYKENKEDALAATKLLPLMRKMLIKDGNGKPFAKIVLPQDCSISD